MRYAESHPDLTAFVSGGLEPDEAREVERHLSSCSLCRNELEGLRKVNRALAAAPPPVDPPSHLKGEILARMRAERSSRPVYAEPEKQTRAPEVKRFYLLSGAAAAAVVAVVALGLFFGLPAEKPPVATIRLVPTPEEAAGLDGYWGVAKIASSLQQTSRWSSS